ncbi:kinase-like domain-containing protein [Roridomyces roridus]|uniref:Kinase-like domain-containing protein n=1 Tax=Roridomyces roridus TaxID=1738132 RepID=A0AAD7FVZ9_9AGAR|nr:kinase-like domain-containing protein [Roridomyces roridus]
MYASEPEEPMQQTQQDDDLSQPYDGPNAERMAHPELFGYLNPCSSKVNRVDLFKEYPEVKIGRNTNGNHVVFHGFKISNYHATLRWNEQYDTQSVITVLDTSSNGTFINGKKIGKGQQGLLRDGNEIAFGVSMASKEEGGLFDYRFIFRDFVTSSVTRALYNSYDLTIELGKGSFATVYKALRRASGEWVAVKVIHETKRQPTTNPQSSGREIQIMQELFHPNICRLREVFWNDNGSIDLVLELIEGGDLLDFILRQGGLSEPMSQHITFQLCQALSYIHGKGIAHRDLKPENVLLTSDEPPIVKVADFGLAKIVDSVTMLRTMCGTPSYLAPEVVTQQNNSGYDSLVDSWSVGVILFSMLSNTNPFLENSVDDLKTRIAERTIDWTVLDSLRYGPEERPLSDQVRDFLYRLLDFDPRQRMRLSDALRHPWLNNYQFVHSDTIDYSLYNGESGTLVEDVSMRSVAPLSPTSSPGPEGSLSQNLKELKLSLSRNESLSTVANGHGDSPNGVLHDDTEGTPPPPGLTPVKKGGLQRRSEVLRDAAEMGKPPVEPSWEMVNYMSQSQGQSTSDEELYGQVTQPPSSSGPTTTNGSGGKKRARGQLTPLPEEGGDVDGEDESRASSPLSDLSDSPEPAPARKKTRTNGEATPAKPKTKRGGAARTPASTRKGKTKESEDEGSAPVGVRRSTRAKTARR